MNALAKPVMRRVAAVTDPSVRDRVRAGMHLHAVLPRLDEVARFDEEGGRLVRQMGGSMELRALGGPRVVLRFDQGRVSASDEGSSSIGLLFPSCSSLNRMFDGEKVIPLPFKGAWRVGDLKRFTRLTEILTRYLKPSAEDLEDPLFKARHVEMSLLVGLAATAVLARHDPKGARIAEHLPSGTMLYTIKGGPSCHVSIDGDRIIARSGSLDEPTTTIEIRDLDLAVGLIKGEVDTFAANGSGAIKASGSLVLADEFNVLFDRVGLYLS
ncbi:MAG: hypothetical protein ACOCVR_04345 [Myxococcota bacterium]